ncbi:MAG: hypothetical protein ACI8S6_000557 [Myxococcota bacterium]
MSEADRLSGALSVLRGSLVRWSVPDIDTLIGWDDELEALARGVPSASSLDGLSEDAAAAALAAAVVEIEACSGFGASLLAPLSLETLLQPAALLERVHIHPRLPEGMYARSQPYRGRIELSPPSEDFYRPHHHLAALCEGRLPLELRALQHELIHLRQVDAPRELAWLMVLAVFPLLWPVLIYLFFARIFPPTAASFLAVQEIEAQLGERELDSDPAGAASRTIVALSAYPFARHLAPGALEGATALVQALRAMDMDEASMAALFRTMRPGQGLLALAEAVQAGCVQRGWDSDALRRAIRQRELLLLVDQLLVKVIARRAAAAAARALVP